MLITHYFAALNRLLWNQYVIFHIAQHRLFIDTSFRHTNFLISVTNPNSEYYSDHYHYCIHLTFQTTLYRALLLSAPAHRQFVQDIMNLRDLVPDLPDGSTCPTCAETKDTLPQIVSLDGNFRLVRKRSAGPSYCKPHTGTGFFIPPEQAEPFLLQPTLPRIDVCKSIFILYGETSAYRLSCILFIFTCLVYLY